MGREAAQGPKEQDFHTLLAYIQDTYGLDCSQYKETFVRRRVATRLRARGIRSYKEYLHLLRKDPHEHEHLLAALMVGFTTFFRDASMFEVLRDMVLTPLLRTQSRRGERRLTVWSAGCATGEETYSLAILLWQMLGPRLRRWHIHILGTDIDGAALQQAQAGVYSTWSFRGTRWPGLDKAFTSTPKGYAVIPAIKSLVQFRYHNLLASPPPGRFDLILCRNVLIYFQRSQQARLCRAFHSALVSGGTLVLGKTESLPPEVSPAFETLHLRERIYRKRVS